MAHFQFLCSLATFKLSSLDVRHPNRIPSYSTAIRQDIRAACFCSCKMHWCSNECILLPCFNALPDIFAVMNCSVLTLPLSAVFCSGLVTGNADKRVRRVRVEYTLVCKHECDVILWPHKLRMSVKTTTIRYCSVLQFGGVAYTIKQSPRASSDLCTPLLVLLSNRKLQLKIFVLPVYQCWLVNAALMLDKSGN